MIYKFSMLSDEVDNFKREIKINSGATFLEFNNIILESVNYAKDEITSFFICTDNWEKQEEITLVEMESNSETDIYLMDKTDLDEFITDEGQRLMFIFDNLNQRAFYLELKSMESGNLDKAECTKSIGKAPLQLVEPDLSAEDLQAAATTGDVMDTNMYGDSEFNDEDLDDNGLDNMGGLDDLSDVY